ncbi:MAG: molybdopterin-dependent oxidoreductase, partial [Dehalococcoidia bacterium]|nr:molybdopterin-dependent oxidoreductase [Dehalococcoidia bacterium]
MFQGERKATMEQGVEIKKAVCPWCKAECGVLVKVKDGHLLSVEEDPDWPRKVYPPTKGCARLRAAKEWFYHPDKVKYPKKRVGEKGGGKWEEISWEQALDEIAAKLKEIKENYGAEAVSYTSGTEYRTESVYKGRFFNLFGSPNGVHQSQICFGPRTVMGHVMVGMFPHFSIRPITKCIVLIGVEPLVSRPITAKVLLDAKERGAKFIVIDPRFTRSASMADVWLPLRPGTDCALLMGMVNVIIKEELYDKQFINEWCHGFDQLKARAAEYSLDRVSGITDLPKEKIAEAARIYATNRPGSFVEGMGIEHLADARNILQARWALAALAGNVDVEGGEELVGAPHNVVSLREVELSEKLSQEQRDKQLGSDRFRLFSWPGYDLLDKSVQKVWGKKGGGCATFQAVAHGPTVFRAILTGQPYPVKAMITASSNPMVTQGNTKLVYQALKKLDLYVVIDFWMTPSAELADYVLPPASWLERPLVTTFSDYANSIVAGEASLPPKIEGEYDHLGDY